MNERIRELAEDAGGHYSREELEFAVVFGELEDFERFAELIVRECYEMCKGNLIEKGFGLSTAHDLSYNEGVMDCAIMVKNLFGVK